MMVFASRSERQLFWLGVVCASFLGAAAIALIREPSWLSFATMAAGLVMIVIVDLLSGNVASV